MESTVRQVAQSCSTILDHPTTGAVVAITTTPVGPSTWESKVVGGRMDGRSSLAYSLDAALKTHQLWVDACRRVMWRDGLPMEPIGLGQPWHRLQQRYKGGR